MCSPACSACWRGLVGDMTDPLLICLFIFLGSVVGLAWCLLPMAGKDALGPRDGAGVGDGEGTFIFSAKKETRNERG